MSSTRVQKATQVVDTTLAIKLDLRAVVDGVVQWVQTADAGTATIEVFGTALKLENPVLDDLPATPNPYWFRLLDPAGVPINFTAEPTGADTGGGLGFWRNSLQSMLVLFTVTGTATLEVWTHYAESP